MPDSYSAVLTIDISAILANYRLLAAQIAPAICGAAVKADCYGLGATIIAPHLHRAGCQHFFVATVDEGLALRPFLSGASIYVMNGLPTGAEQDVAHNNLIPVLNSVTEIERWLALGQNIGTKRAGLQFDTGLNRLGLSFKDILYLQANEHLPKRLDLALIMSHLACADHPQHPQNDVQLRRFHEILRLLPLSPKPAKQQPLHSLAASSAIFLGSDYHFDLARPGAALYGIKPFSEMRNPLQQAVRLQAKILQLREVDLNMTVGYGASHQFQAPSVLATIGVGYADGIFRTLGNRGTVFVAGKRAPIVGRISMDLMTIDVGHLPRESVTLGMNVDIIGAEQSLDAIAHDAGTIGYEILTNLGPRLQRRYVGAQA